MINIKIQKKDLWLLAAIMVFIVGVGYVIAYSQPIPNPGHGGDNIYISINGSNKDLQAAIDSNNFNSCSLIGGSYPLPIVHGHKGEEIIINVNGTVKTLQQAINDSSLVNAEAGTSPSNFGSVIYGETGDEIWININGTEKTLQQAINNGNFKCLPQSTPPTKICEYNDTMSDINHIQYAWVVYNLDFSLPFWNNTNVYPPYCYPGCNSVTVGGYKYTKEGGIRKTISGGVGQIYYFYEICREPI